MLTLSVDLGSRAYPIYIAPGLLNEATSFLPHLAQKQAVIISNTVVAPLYLDRLRATLETAQVKCLDIILPDGEAYKDTGTLNNIYDELLEKRAERKTTLIALGGGVIGDITGFAAATYLRGVPFIQVPTTLLAQVDSSVGGKTGINHPLGKNMIGAFYQPQCVVADIATLATLPAEELSSGLAEVIKYGLIRDAEFFVWLEANMEALLALDPKAMAYAILRSCENKAVVVAADEREAGQRALLNLGHTFGHAIETGSGYGQWLHGEAVAAGTRLAADLSQRMGLIDANTVSRIDRLYARAGLSRLAPELGSATYLRLMGLDKKVEAGKMRFVLLRDIGNAFITADIPPGLLEQTLDTICA